MRAIPFFGVMSNKATNDDVTELITKNEPINSVTFWRRIVNGSLGNTSALTPTNCPSGDGSQVDLLMTPSFYT